MEDLFAKIKTLLPKAKEKPPKQYTSIAEFSKIELKNNECGIFGVASPIDPVEGRGKIHYDFEVYGFTPSRAYLKTHPEPITRLQLHFICFYRYSLYFVSGIAIDKVDGKLYEINSFTGDADSSATFSFSEVSFNQVLKFAEQKNKPLYEALKLSGGDTKKLLDFTVYTAFSDKYYYIEMFRENDVVLCSIGLHSNKMRDAGWLGKLVNKDFEITYAECSYNAYQQLKDQYPMLYNRSKAFKNNKNLFHYYNEAIDNRNRNKDLTELIEKNTNLGRYNVSFYSTTSPGFKIHEENCIGPRWMEEFCAKCKEYFAQNK